MRTMRTDSSLGVTFTGLKFANLFLLSSAPPRPLEEIDQDIRGIEADILRMLSEVTGGPVRAE